MNRDVELTAWIIVGLIAIVATIVAACGCAATKIAGGTHTVSSAKNTSHGGDSEATSLRDFWGWGPKMFGSSFDSVLRINPDGSVEMRRTVATTQTSEGGVTSLHHSSSTTRNADTMSMVHNDSTTQPSATSDGLLTLDGDSIVVRANKVAERFKAVWWQCTAMIIFGVFLAWRGRIMIGALLVLGGFTILAYPEAAVVGAILAAACLIWHYRTAWTGIDKAVTHAREKAVTEGTITTEDAKKLESYTAEKTDGWLQRASKLFP